MSRLKIRHWLGLISLCGGVCCYIIEEEAAACDTGVKLQIADAYGIHFHHRTGSFTTAAGTPSKYMPETMGAGVTIFDSDNDGRLDLLFLNGQPFNDQKTFTPALYRNLGNWRFADITARAGLATLSLYGMGAVAADYDADGDQDLVFTGLGGVRLYNNDGGFYRDVSESSGVSAYNGSVPQQERNTDWITAAALFDADGDGDLDILAANYVKWSPQKDIHTTYDGRHKGYTTPRAYEGQPMRLWLQQAGHSFEAVETTVAGLPGDGKSLGMALWDFDGDGRLDVVVANDTTANFLLHNLGGGRFAEIGLRAGIAFDGSGNTRAGMGIDIADYGNNQRPGVAIGNFQDEPTSLFRVRDLWRFQEDSVSTGIAATTLNSLTFGLVFADLDLDGWQDILTANGHVEPDIGAVYDGVSHAQPLQWLKNCGNGRFRDMTAGFAALNTPLVGRGLAVGDLDNDGDQDIVASANGGAPRLIENLTDNGSYLRVKLLGAAPNTNAIGARLWLKGRRYTQQRTLTTGGSYLSQSELIQTFGIGADNPSRELLVQWPDGSRVSISEPRSRQTLVITQ